MVDFSVLQYKDVRLAMGAVIFNTTLVIAAWFGRAYWMHGIEAVVNKLQARQPAYTSTPDYLPLGCTLPACTQMQITVRYGICSPTLFFV